MKQLAIWLIGGILGVMLLLLAVINLFRNEALPASAIVIPIDPTVTALEQRLSRQELSYQAQMEQLEQELRQQQLDGVARSEALQNQITAARQTLAQLQQQAQMIQTQVEALEEQTGRPAAAQEVALQQARDQYAALQAQLAAVQAELAETQVRLGN